MSATQSHSTISRSSSAVAGAARVLERALRSLGARRRLAAEVVRLGDEPPGAREPEVVAELLEDGDRLLGDLEQLRAA